ncbi:MAG: 16S rRNA methyltransferase [Thermoprotei archaeon]|nr:MAG: 16S rRNA methyltransferase [Thermoprotei archaeon]
MRRLHLLLAEAGLELVPRELWSHPAVRATARRRMKRPGEILLDVSLHMLAMSGLRDREKRGRPDIVHFCTLLALGSLLNRAGLLEVHIHTYGGKVIGVAPHVRLPRNYNRFVGLMEQLLLEGRVPPSSKEPLLWVEEGGLEDLLKRASPSRVFLLSEKGSLRTAKALAEELVREEEPMAVIGCFQAGDFRDALYEIADEVVSISKATLDAWVVTAKLLCSIEDVLGLV